MRVLLSVGTPDMGVPTVGNPDRAAVLPRGSQMAGTVASASRNRSGLTSSSVIRPDR